MKTQIAIIGGGPAGLAAAVAAREAGVQDILIIERDHELGGILNQCIHNGFGLHTFHEELTGPEYAARYIAKVKEMEIPYLLETMVVDISADKVITAMNREQGIFMVEAEAVILAMGCRERPRGALNIPGYRPAGIYSAGTAQRFVNMEGRMPGKKVVILGSGDIGLIMARRMTMEGAEVKAVAELMPYSGGLKRNIVQCLDDYNIPLKLSHTVVEIKGKERVEGVILAQVDEKRKPIPGTEEEYECDTLLISCGLIPENELSTALGVTINPVTSGPVVNESLETNIGGVFACGNVLHVHDLVDYVSEEADMAGRNAALYVRELSGTNNQEPGHDVLEREPAGCPESDPAVSKKTGQQCMAVHGKYVELKAINGVRYTVPAKIDPVRMQEKQVVRFRVGNVYKNCYLSVYFNDTLVNRIKKRVMAPGEMEQIILRKSDLQGFDDLKTITVKIEA